MPLFTALCRFSSTRVFAAPRRIAQVRAWDDPQLNIPTYLRRGLVIAGLPDWRGSPRG